MTGSLVWPANGPAEQTRRGGRAARASGSSPRRRDVRRRPPAGAQPGVLLGRRARRRPTGAAARKAADSLRAPERHDVARAHPAAPEGARQHVHPPRALDSRRVRAARPEVAHATREGTGCRDAAGLHSGHVDKFDSRIVPIIPRRTSPSKDGCKNGFRCSTSDLTEEFELSPLPKT